MLMQPVALMQGVVESSCRHELKITVALIVTDPFIVVGLAMEMGAVTVRGRKETQVEFRQNKDMPGRTPRQVGRIQQQSSRVSTVGKSREKNRRC